MKIDQRAYDHPKATALLAGVLAALIPLMGTKTLWGSILMAVVMFVPIAWTSCALGFVACAMSVSVAFPLIAWGGSESFAISWLMIYAMPFLVLSLVTQIWGTQCLKGRVFWGVLTACAALMSVWLSYKIQIPSWEETKGSLLSFSGQTLFSPKQQRAIELILKTLPGLSSLMLSLCIFGVISWVSAQIRRTGRATLIEPGHPHIEKIFSIAYALIVVVVSMISKNDIGTFHFTNIIVPLSLIPLMRGILIVHQWAQHTAMGKITLFFFYFLLFSMLWMIVIVTFIGLLDPWLKWETRVSKLKRPDE